MKYICLILVFIIAALSAKPCSDEFVSVKERLSAISKTVDSDKEHSGAHDLCSPFCQCSCCNTTTIASTPETLVTVIPELIANSYSELLPEKVLNTPASIWQPPKVLC